MEIEIRKKYERYKLSGEKLSEEYLEGVEWFIVQNLYYRLEILTPEQKNRRFSKLTAAF